MSPGLRRQISRTFASRLVAFLLTFVCFAQPQRSSQFAQAAKAVLDRNFANPDISYLLLNTSGDILAERWNLQTAVPPGSLVKPFLAIAYAEQHEGRFPSVFCEGTSTRCWLPAGHGKLELEEAIAQSCNSYFLRLAAGLDRNRAALTFARYGLAGPSLAEANSDVANDSLIGVGTNWKEQPLALARAYLALERERNSPVPSRIVNGMIASAAHGTARGVDLALGTSAALAKTGTAACAHSPEGPADGFSLVLYPARQPRLLLLVRVHGVTGAASATTAGAMLRALGAGQ